MKRQNTDNGPTNTGNYKRSRQDNYNEALAEGKFELRILFPDRWAGAIIGKGGEYIKAIREKYEASLTVPDRGTPERVLNIVARQENVVDCFKEVMAKLAEVQEPKRDGEMDVRVLIHQSHAGGVIGRGGSKIKEFREQTGANLKVFQDVCPYSTDRVVLISGSEEKIAIALQALIDFIKEIPVKGIQKPYDASNYDPRGAYNYGGFEMNQRYNNGGRGGFGGRGGGRGPPPPPMGRGPPPHNAYGGGYGYDGGHPSHYGGDGYGGGGNYGRGGMPPPMNHGGYMGDPGLVTSTQVTIPNELGGTIIGKGGERINRIRMESGARIDVGKPGGNDERIITITGTPHEIQSAQFLLQQRMLSTKFIFLHRAVTPRFIPTCSMYQNPHLENFKKKRSASTGLTGLFVNEHPHHSLRIVYGRIIRALQKIPANAQYRINTEQIVKHRLLLEPDIHKLEEKIGMGQLEELATVRDIVASKAWEPLVEELNEEQWRWPIH